MDANYDFGSTTFLDVCSKIKPTPCTQRLKAFKFLMLSSFFKLSVVMHVCQVLLSFGLAKRILVYSL